MPTYIDIHDLPGDISAEEIAKAHQADEQVQGRHGVQYHKYWINRKSGKLFCMCTAPSAQAADDVHREAHGMVAEKIIEVTPEIADAFMGAAEVDQGGAALAPRSREHDSGTRTVLFTDIVDSTSLTQRLGDDAAMRLIGVHDSVVRAALADEDGREVKHTGDGIMAAFSSAVAAIRCGIKVQQGLARQRADEPGAKLQVRVGIAAGEPIERHNDLFGSAVQLAARLCAQAEVDGILVSNAVAELCAGKGLQLQSIGAVALKGFDEPVQAHRVQIS
ncbi:MAG: nickel-binding protein [Quisquiliibacterium sp.]